MNLVGKRVENDIKAIMPEPQAILYEKTMFPFIIFSKKRYVGLLYEDDANKKPKLKSMGIVLKRRDNAMIVKKIYGGIIDILLYKYDLNAAVDFLRTELQKLINGEYPLEDLIVTKTLKGTYKDRTKIAHATLVDRMGERGDEKPQVNDRIPYVYIDVKGEHIKLQGDRIEHPDYIREHGLMPDYQFYITNQLTKPIAQIFALCVEKLPNYSYPPSYWMQADEELRSNTIYGDNDLKRHSRIVALKQKETIALLFDEFVIKKERVSRKKVVIQKHTLSLDETPKISLSVTDMKVQKQFKGEFELTVKSTVIHVDEFFIDKKNRMSKKQAITLMMLKIMKLLENDHSELIQEKGILLNLEKSYMTTLKKALEDHEKLNENLDKAVSEADFESIYDNTEMIESFKIAKMIYRYKYMFL